MRTWRIVTGLVTGMIALVACGGGEDRLEALARDPMATYELPSAIDSTTTKFAGGDSAVSSPSMIRTTFEVPDGTALATIEEIAASATEAGWALEPRAPIGYTDDRQVDGVRARILISGIDDDDTVWVEISSRDS